MRHVAVAVMFVVACAITAAGQAVDSAPARVTMCGPYSPVQLVRTDSWNTSAIQAITTRTRAVWVTQKQIQGQGVTVSHYYADNIPAGDIPLITPLSDGKLLMDTPRLVITGVDTMEAKGRVYAYVLRVVKEHYDEKSNTGGYGPEYELILVDEEGGGTIRPTNRMAPYSLSGSTAEMASHGLIAVALPHIPVHKSAYHSESRVAG